MPRATSSPGPRRQEFRSHDNGKALSSQQASIFWRMRLPALPRPKPLEALRPGASIHRVAAIGPAPRNAARLLAEMRRRPLRLSCVLELVSTKQLHNPRRLPIVHACLGHSLVHPFFAFPATPHSQSTTKVSANDYRTRKVLFIEANPTC